LHCSVAGCDHRACFGARTLTLDFAPTPDVSVWLVESCSEAAFATAFGGIITGSPVIAIGRSGRTEETGGNVADASMRSDALATPSVDGVVPVCAMSGVPRTQMPVANTAATGRLIASLVKPFGSFSSMADVLGNPHRISTRQRHAFVAVPKQPEPAIRCRGERKSIADNDGELNRPGKPQTEKPAYAGAGGFLLREPVRSPQL
jgi:hypothetical protein